MIRPSAMWWSAAAVAFALAACADPAEEPPARPPATPPDAAAGASRPVPKPEFKKPVRMNGRGEVSSISLERFFALHEAGKALVIDARPAFIYHLGHIPGAIHLPKNGCDEAIHRHEAEFKAALTEGRTLVVYCTGVTCPDARTVARHLSGFGYPASIFSGGWDAWKEAGMPVE